MTKKLYHITSEDAVGELDDVYDRIGEADFFVTEDGLSIVTWWSKDDASWRPEYMRDLLKFFDQLPNPDKQFSVMSGISHASFQQKNYKLAYHVLHGFFTHPPLVFTAKSH